MGFLRNRLRAWAAVGLLPACGLATRSDAQVVLDGTLGSTGSLSGPNFQVTPDKGKQVGGNLFHSFQTFNLAAGESATFSGPESVQRVLTRVTGGTASNIDGTLRCTIPNADFYFVNPAGVVFGPNASLDVQGSFAVTTADVIKFADDSKFVVSNAADPVLTSAPPVAFGFVGPSRGSVAVDGAQLGVGDGKHLAVVSGGVRISGGRLTAPAGRLTIVGAGTGGEARIPLGDLATPVDLVDSPELSDIVLEQSSELNLEGERGGRVDVIGRDATISSSRVDATTTGAADGLGIELTATRDLSITDETQVVADTESSGRAGNVTVRAGTLQVLGGGRIASDTFGSGAGVGVEVQAQSILIDGRGSESATGISAGSVLRGKGGDAGNVTVRAGTLKVLGGGEITSFTFGLGAGGGVEVEAESILIDRDGAPFTTRIGATSESKVEGGDAGNVTVRAGTLQLLGGGDIASVTFGLGAAGNVDVEAESILIDRRGSMSVTGVSATSESEVEGGDAGNVTVRAGTLQVLSGGRIASDTFGLGAAGGVEVDADSILIDRRDADFFTGFTATSESTGPGGDAGSVTVRTGTLGLLSGGRISSNTRGSGAGGTVEVRADSILIDRQGSTSITRISAESESTGQGGNAGSVTVRAGTLEVLGGGDIISITRGLGAAGNVDVEADSLLIDGRGAEVPTGISAASEPVKDGDAGGNAGNVTVRAGKLEVLDGGDIGSSTFGLGAGGGVEVRADSILIDKRGSGLFTGISARSESSGEGGDAGNVTVRAGTLDVLGGGEIRSDTGGSGAGGNVDVQADSILIDREGSEFFTGITAQADGGGNAGSVSVSASGDLYVRPGSSISSRAALGNGGDVTVSSNETINVDGGFITAAAEMGNAGSISMTAGDSINVRRGSSITTEARAGTGGNIKLRAPEAVRIFDSKITARAFRLPPEGGPAAEIDIDPRFVILRSSEINGRITDPAAMQDVTVIIDPNASFVRSSDSTIESNAVIAPVEVDIAGSLARLPMTLGAGARLEAACHQRLGIPISTFVVTGQGGSAPAPGGWLTEWRLERTGR